MESRIDNTLFVMTEDETTLEIRVIDIVTRRKGLKKKEFLFYVEAENPFEIHASILDEKRDSYTLLPIEDPDDIKFADEYDLDIETIVEMARGDIPEEDFVDMWLEYLAKNNV